MRTKHKKMSKNIFNRRQVVFFGYRDDKPEIPGGEIINGFHDRYQFGKWWRALDADELPYSSREEELNQKRNREQFFGIVSIKAPQVFTQPLSQRLPWDSMMRNSGYLEKFFGCGNWGYLNENIGLPRTFQYGDDSIDPIFTNVDCDRKIMSYLDIYDFGALSTCSKKYLRLSRSNTSMNTLSLEEHWIATFVNKGKEFREIHSKENRLSEYEIWWYCSAVKLLNLLWHRWEDYLQDEKDMEWRISENKIFWYEEQNSDSDNEYWNEPEYEGDYDITIYD